MPLGILRVYGLSGGVSTGETTPVLTRTSERAWYINAGETIPPELSINEDPPGSGHWLWEAAYDMPFVDYVLALSSVNTLFR
jgi:hypothetical protein